jgi:hypothetical protein
VGPPVERGAKGIVCGRWGKEPILKRVGERRRCQFRD